MNSTKQIPLDAPALEMFTMGGILRHGQTVPSSLKLFATQADQVLDKVRAMVCRREMSPGRAGDFQQLMVDACARVMCHPIIASNNYLGRFSQGVTVPQARHEIQQFSVFGLQFEDLGKIWIARPGTRQFVETTFSTYASTDQSIAAGASFGIENWAANALWTPWIAGMRKLNESLEKKVDLGYLTYHEAQEAHHSQATIDELFENFMEPWFNVDRFLDGAETILTHGVQAYYESQLESLPDKDDSWPKRACEPRSFDGKRWTLAY